MKPSYTPTRAPIRFLLAAAALAATFASGALIDGLARGYISEALLAAGKHELASVAPTR